MTQVAVEHANMTVADPDKSAALFSRLFGWKIRWSGTAIGDGYSVHVGSDTSYLALYNSGSSEQTDANTYEQVGGLNHIGLVVDDLDEIERRVRSEGIEPYSYADYEPGRRFYFNTEDGIEIEIVSYQ